MRSFYVKWIYSQANLLSLNGNSWMAILEWQCQQVYCLAMADGSEGKINIGNYG